MKKIYLVYPKKIGTIAPEIYGHFSEHIGGVIYDGLWVGEDSDVPNIKGFRKDAAKKIFSYCEIDRFAFDFEAILIGQRIGAVFTEIPVTVKNHGESKVHVIRETLRMLSDLRRMKKRIKKLDIS